MKKFAKGCLVRPVKNQNFIGWSNYNKDTMSFSYAHRSLTYKVKRNKNYDDVMLIIDEIKDMRLQSKNYNKTIILKLFSAMSMCVVYTWNTYVVKV